MFGAGPILAPGTISCSRLIARAWATSMRWFFWYALTPRFPGPSRMSRESPKRTIMFCSLMVSQYVTFAPYSA